MKLIISKSLKEKLPLFNVSCYTFELLEKNDENDLSSDISNLFNEITDKYQQIYSLEDVVKIKRIKDTRDGYKILGKDPSHTRAACEALLRRIIKNGNIYRLGNIIDLGNYLSLRFLKSVCVVDKDKLVGDINIRIGNINDEYYGINRGLINVSNIPLYTDDISPFGNPTSDTLRTAITSQTKNVCLMLINFNFDDVDEDEKELENILKKYLKIKNLTKIKSL